MPRLDSARTAVGWSFALNGFAFASLMAQVPQVRAGLGLSNRDLGLLLLALSLGSILALPTTGLLVHRWGAAQVVAGGAVTTGVGIGLVGWGADELHSVAATTLGLFIYGIGTAVWDVPMNVEGADVERRLGRSILPRFHAGFSLGTMAGALGGAVSVRLGVPSAVHMVACALIAAAFGVSSSRRFLSVRAGATPEMAGRSGDGPPDPGADRESAAPGSGLSPLAAWGELRTVLIGLMMLSLALMEGAANDWLALALIDGYRAPGWLAVAGYGLFVSCMTIGRLMGPVALNRFGRAPVLRGCMALAGIGVVSLVFGGHPALAVLGIVAWGFGAALAIPVGISAASDDPAKAAARVSVVTTIAYGAFFAGPPVLGLLADHFGTLRALSFLVLLLVPSALLVPAARESRSPRRWARRDPQVGTP